MICMNISLENLSQEKSTALWLYSEYMAVLGLPEMNNTSLIESVYDYHFVRPKW